MMKTIKILFLFVGMLVSSIVYAQSGHRECAPGCISNQAQGKGRVTCIDEVCTICHEKQEKERKEKLKADKLAAQKRAQQAEQRKQQQTKLIADQKKQVAIQRQKAKENELVFLTKTETISSSLKGIQEQLPPNFVRCHKSYVVNLNFVKQNNAKEYVLTNLNIVPKSRTYPTK